MFGVALGLAHVHALYVAHGDFGTAHFAHGLIIGYGGGNTTLYVRSPERLLGAEESSTAIDRWAWGVQLWQGRVLGLR